MKHKMTLDRTTKGTVVYKGEAPITSLYVKHEAFKGKEPSTEITLEIKEI